MSARSFPSLTSDSSSTPSRSSDLHDPHRNDNNHPAVSSRSSSPHVLSLKDPEASSEVIQLRNKVSKLEQDKFVLGDYAAELQSRIQQLERERMGNHDAINHDPETDPKERPQNQSSCIAQPSSSRPRSTEHPCTPRLLPVSYNQTPVSFSAAIPEASRRATGPVSSLSKTPNLTPSQSSSLSTRVRLVPKRSTPPAASVAVSTPVLDPPSAPLNTFTPTRRRLQAMCGRLSLGTASQPPPMNETASADNDSNVHQPRFTPHARNFNSMPSRRSNGRNNLDPGVKRTAFTSKLDSVILTSKLFPLSSSRPKAPAESASAGPSQNGYMAVVSLAHTIPSSSSPSPGSVLLNSPPRHRPKVRAAAKGDKLLSRSQGLEEICSPELQPAGVDKNVRSRGRVSFSERLFPSPSERGDGIDTQAETAGRVWGSWSRRKRPPQMTFNTETRARSPLSPTPSALSPQISPEDGNEPGENRYHKRRSLAAGCLKFISGCNERDWGFQSEKRESRALLRAHSDSRKARSHSRSHSPTRNRVWHHHGNSIPGNFAPRDYENDQITPLRVGSPKPKGRISDIHHSAEQPERTSSLRSAGKWGQRGRPFSPEFTRRRTIHPMFSFERPQSTGASASSSRRPDAGETVDGDRRVGIGASVEKPPRRSPRTILAEHGVSSSLSHNHAIVHVQDDSGASGNTVMRSDSASTHKSKGPMMRTRVGIQTHGTFAFEPATAVTIPPRSAPPHGSFIRGESSNETRTHVSDRNVRTNETANRRNQYVQDAHDRTATYLEFCDDLKVVIGDGEEWATFTKYVRRFDIEILTEDVLLRRVKKLIDGSRSVDHGTKLKLYERFVNIVRENVDQHVGLGS